MFGLIDGFYWFDIEEQNSHNLTDSEKYKEITVQAAGARGKNPRAFDALTEWMLDDAQWIDQKSAENEQIFLQGVVARFKEQNAKLRKYLLKIRPSDIVNTAVFKALDRFDRALSPSVPDAGMQEAADKMFADFSVMRERGLREVIAGNKTGPTGTDSVALFGYINYLKDCDAGVQWALFMPDVAAAQQKGFKVESFEYIKMPAMRFIGQEGDFDSQTRSELFRVLDGMNGYQSDLAYDVFFMHHYGLGVDVGEWHGVWGRFMKADTPVPEGFLFFDFVPYNDGKKGPSYISQFAYAVFSGDTETMHSRDGYDSDAMYDVTRNIMLSQGVPIPYPDKYWTAEVFPVSHDKISTAYMFSAELN